MNLRKVHHSRWIVVLVLTALLVIGLRAYGIDGVSVRIAWYRLRLLSGNPATGVAQIENLAALGDRGTRHLMWWGVLHDLDPVQLAAIQVLHDRGEMAACPAFIRALDDGSPAVRAAANDALMALSGQDVGFNPYAAWANRRNEVRMWQEWWEGRRFDAPAESPMSPIRRGLATDGD